MPQRFKGTVFQFVHKAQNAEFVDNQFISFANFIKPSRLFSRSLSLKREVLLLTLVYLPEIKAVLSSLAEAFHMLHNQR